MSPAVPVADSNAGRRCVNGVEKIFSRNEQTPTATKLNITNTNCHFGFHHINRRCLASSPCISPQTPCNHYRQAGTLNLTACLLCALTPDVLAHEDSQICRVPRRRSKHCSMFHHVDDSRKRHDDRLSRGRRRPACDGWSRVPRPTTAVMMLTYSLSGNGNSEWETISSGAGNVGLSFLISVPESPSRNADTQKDVGVLKGSHSRLDCTSIYPSLRRDGPREYWTSPAPASPFLPPIPFISLPDIVILRVQVPEIHVQQWQCHCFPIFVPLPARPDNTCSPLVCASPPLRLKMASQPAILPASDLILVVGMDGRSRPRPSALLYSSQPPFHTVGAKSPLSFLCPATVSQVGELARRPQRFSDLLLHTFL